MLIWQPHGGSKLTHSVFDKSLTPEELLTVDDESTCIFVEVTSCCLTKSKAYSVSSDLY